MSNDTQPEIRFPGFTDDWEERKLSGIIEKLSGGASIKPTDYLEDGIRTIPKGAVNATGIADLSGSKYISEDFFEKNITSHAHTSNLVTSLRDLVPSAPNMGRIVRIEGDDEQFLMPQGVYKLELFEGIDEDFLISFSNSDKYRKIISAEKNGSTQVHIRNGEFLNIDINLPSEHEQKKIGSFFKQLDNTIALHQRKLDLLKETKKGFLQKMFPKNGAKVPEIRFPGFTEDWEQRKLASMTNYKNGKGHEDKQSTIGKLELINLNSISISGGLKHSGKFIDEADDTLQKDDLVMILSDVGHGDLLGRVALIPEDDRFVLNQRVALLRPNATADPQFLFSYINAHQYYFKAQGAGMSQLNISKGSVENFISFVPIIEEQKKIGTFFKQLDNTITLHQRKLDLLKETKKGFLQKMFV
ncbi:restriction endonuclease subunit S [Enterococcus faecium]